MATQQLNRTELIGYVGAIRTSQVGGTLLATMNVATNAVCRTLSGETVIETTWTVVTCFQKDVDTDLRSLSKGDAVHVTGRLRCDRYTGADGVERTSYGVVASSVSKVDAPLEPQKD